MEFKKSLKIDEKLLEKNDECSRRNKCSFLIMLIMCICERGHQTESSELELSAILGFFNHLIKLF